MLYEHKRLVIEKWAYVCPYQVGIVAWSKAHLRYFNFVSKGHHGYGPTEYVKESG